MFAVALLFFSALFSASETALFSIPRSDFARLRSSGVAGRSVYRLLANGEETLISLLLGNLFVNLFVISSFSRILYPLMRESMLLTAVATTALLLLFGEILPKNYALANSEKFSLFVAPLLEFLVKLFRPVVTLIRRANRHLLRFYYHILLRSPAPYITAKEYRSALASAVEEGSLSSEAEEVISRLLHISRMPLAPLVVHRGDIVTVPSGLGSGEKLAVAYSDDDSLCELWYDGKAVAVKWLPLSRTVGDFLSLSVAAVCVADEYGDFYGVATLSSYASYLRAGGEAGEESDQSSFEVAGGEPVVNIVHLLPASLVARYPNMKTLNGLLTAWSGEILSAGNTLFIESYIFTVLESDGRVIQRVRIEKEV